LLSEDFVSIFPFRKKRIRIDIAIGHQKLKRYVMAWARFVIAAGLLMVVVSCKPVEERVVGQWQSEDQVQSVTFSGDGTAVFIAYGRSVNAKYKFTDAAHARFDFDSPLGELEGTQIALVTIENETLSLEFESGVTRSYVRSKG
jgi:hypothetical protein